MDTGTTWDTTLSGSGSNQHLYSTLLHEFAHVVGLGTALSWAAQIDGDNEFIGAESIVEYGADVPLFDSGGGNFDHWEEGITSDIRGTTTSQEVAFDPNITAGDVKLLTNLDVAGLDDIGWDIASIPEPSLLSLVCAGSLMLLRRRR